MTETPCWLVVNADDGGIHPDCDAAILEAARRGRVLGSASVLATGEHASAFVDAATAEGLGLGLHFNLTEGRPLGGPYRTLTAGSGDFHRPKQQAWELAAAGRFDPDEVAEEAKLQWQRLVDLGVRPDHVNGHNHIHVFPDVLTGLARALGPMSGLFLRVPDEPECPSDLRPALPERRVDRAGARRLVRATDWRIPEWFLGFRFSTDPSATGVAHLDPARSGVTEWMVHLACRPASAFTRDPRRDAELRVLADPDLGAKLVALGYRPTRFGAIP